METTLDTNNGGMVNMARTTIKDIQDALNILNSIIKTNGYTVKLGQRYGYKALDLYKDNQLMETLRTGMTAGETLTYIHAMLNGIRLNTPKNR